MSRRPTFHAITVDPDGTALDGTQVTEAPAGMLSGLAALLARVAPLFEAEGAGVVILTGPAAEALNLPLTPLRTATEAKDHPALTGPRAVGWRISQVGSWLTAWADDRPAVHVAVHPMLRESTGPLLDPDPWEMSWHLHRFHALAGGPYHTTPGVTGIGLLRDNWRGRKQPYWTPNPKRLPVGTRKAEDAMLWEAARPPAGRYRHSYDQRSMYLAAAGVAPVALGELSHTGARVLPSGQVAGYWRIERPVWNEHRLPNPLGRRPRGVRERGDALWVTGPTMQLLYELAEYGATGEPVVLDGWTGEATRVLRTWAEGLTHAIGEARDSVDPDDAGRQLRALKAVYAEGLGMLAPDTSRVHRPDWRHAVVAQARANLYRKLWRCGHVEDRWPVSVNVDCVTYAADTRDPIEAVPAGIVLGEGAGAFKVESKDEVA